jgi:hypothetical protein
MSHDFPSFTQDMGTIKHNVSVTVTVAVVTVTVTMSVTVSVTPGA